MRSFFKFITNKYCLPRPKFQICFALMILFTVISLYFFIYSTDKYTSRTENLNRTIYLNSTINLNSTIRLNSTINLNSTSNLNITINLNSTTNFNNTFNLNSTTNFNNTFNFNSTINLNDAYLLYTAGCKIPKLDPFHVTVKNFVKGLPVLNCHFKSILQVQNSTIKLNRKYSKKIKCSIQTISRKDDKTSSLSSEKDIDSKNCFVVTSEFVKVTCVSKMNSSSTYTQFYPFITLKDKVEERVRKFQQQQSHPQGDNAFSIILLGLDSVSKNQFLRHMPKTHKFIKHKLTYVELNGYNKIAKNTYNNLVPMLTGNMHNEVPDTTKTWVNVVPLIWKDFMENGYKTMFCEDFSEGSIFNYGRKGFESPPVDYYLRPWSLLVEPFIKQWKTGCLNDRIEAEVIFKWMEDFFDFFPSDPLFALTFLTRMSHDYINNLRYHDKPVRDFLKHLLVKGHLNNTILFFFGDHGFRYGNFRYTYVGRMESRLPLMFIILPSWFPEKYPKLYRNLKVNEHRLTTPLDIHATLKDLLHFKEMDDNHEGTGRSISLLRTQISQSRTCVDANIKSQWCACISRKPVALKNTHVLRSAIEIVDKINSITSVNRTACAELEFEGVVSASKQDVELGEEFKHDGTAKFLISVKVAPSQGIFEGTVLFDGNRTYTVDDGIERINKYGNQSSCIQNNLLKPYCYCNS